MLRSITSNRRAAWARVELAVGKRRPRLTVQRLEDRVNPVSGTFELDGDATSDVTHDWDHVYNDVVLNPSQNTSGSIPGAVTFLHDAVNSPTDDVFTGGQTTDLNDLTEWGHKVGTSPDKADIADVFAAAYEVPVGGTNHTLLTFGADQFHFGGNSSLGFWFFQNPISANANGTFSGTHAAGDVLLLADFSGPVAEIRAFEWVGPSGSAGALQPLPANDDILIARVNNTNTPSGGWPFTDKAGTNPPNTFAPGEFVEAAIDVTALGLGNHIRSFLVETRASNSVNAPLQDFVLVNFNTFTADLTVTKTVNNATPNVGDTVTFTVSVTNKGPNNATGVHLSDVLPPGLAFVSATPSQGTYHTATGAWNVGSLAIGSSATLTLEARVLSQPPNQPPITNTARVTGEAQTDPDSTNDSASVTITPQKADLAVTKVVSDSSPDLGDVISYTITLTNLGPNDAAGVQLRDRLPAGLRFVSASQTQGTYDEVSGIWNVGSLANGASATLVLTAEVTSSAPGTNIARITDADQFDPVTANNSASAPLNAQQVDLVVGKTVSNARPIEGAVVTFVVSVTNRGPNTATNVVLRDVVPAGLTVVSALPSQGAYNPGTGMWTVGAVTTAIPATLQILARVDTAAAKLNLATVIAVDQPDTNPANNSASVSVIPQQSDLAVTKTVSNPRPDVGETVVFTIQVKNNGKSVATGVQINDLVPAGLTLLSASPSQGVYDSASGTWTVGTIIAGATANLQLTVDVTTPDRTTNTASVLALDQFDPVAANDSASATITPRLADLAVTKTVNNPTPNVGDIVTFTVTVRNNGPDTAENIQITDQLPDGYTLISISRSRGIFSAATEVWTIPSLAVGATATLTIRARVDAPTTAPNVATITAATTFDPISANNSAQAGTTVRQADLVVAKAVDNPSPNVGDTVSFTVTVTNTGPDTATNVRVNDLLPAGLTFASATVSQGTYVSTTGAWTVGTLASGATATLLLRATVGTSEQRTNTATATADQFDPISANNTASDSVIPQQSDLVIGKAVDNPTPNLGDTVVFTVVVQNSGPNVATGVQVTDPLPAGLAFVSATTTQGTYASTTGLWVVGTLAVDGEARLEITARATTAPLVLNVARIADADQFDPNLDNNVAGTPVDPQEAELVLTKSVNNNRPNVGDQVIFTVTLTNLGADPATGVQITDNLPPGVVFVSASPDQGTFNAATGIWDVGTIPVDGTLRLDLTVSVVSPNAQLNAARVTDADQPDPNPQNNSASASIIPQQADLAVLKSVDDPRPNVGDTVTFTVTLSNLGKSTVTNVTLTDLLPAGLALVSATPTQGAYDSATGLWSVGTVTPRSAETLVLQARVVSPTPMTNIATVSASDQFDPFTSNNQAQAGVDPQQADLQVLKSVIDPRPNVGDIVTFTVTLTNLGPDTATGVALTDLVPAGLAFVAAAAYQGT